MVSSLVHVLIVTPVIFLWLRERELRRGQSEAEEMQPSASHTIISNITLRRTFMKTFYAILLTFIFALAGCNGNKVNLSSLKPAADPDCRKTHHRAPEQERRTNARTERIRPAVQG